MNDKNFDKANKIIERLFSRTGDKHNVMQELAVMSGSDIIENFRQGGRASRWEKSQRAIREGGQTLVDTSRLMKSAATPQVQGDTIIHGSNLPYAAIHQFGFDSDIKTKNGSRRLRIKARPYLVFSNEFLNDASRVVSRWLLEGV
ncbi:MAG: phage virion morphogenesis protein [Bacteroidota bacterium]|nr:phage virion morphogenesis protein [Bacteroidota bacterium]